MKGSQVRYLIFLAACWLLILACSGCRSAPQAIEVAEVTPPQPMPEVVEFSPEEDPEFLQARDSALALLEDNFGGDPVVTSDIKGGELGSTLQRRLAEAARDLEERDRLAALEFRQSGQLSRATVTELHLLREEIRKLQLRIEGEEMAEIGIGRN